MGEEGGERVKEPSEWGHERDRQTDREGEEARREAREGSCD